MQKKEPPRIELDEELSELEIFQRAMRDVRPLERRKRPPRPPVPPPKPDPDPATEQADYLRNNQMEIHQHPDYVEGGVGSWDRRLLKRLRRGDFSIQEELDLHGMTQPEAREEMDRFLRESCRRGLFCIRIVHGKGKNSPRGRAILREKVPVWLSTRRNTRYVVAFTSASLLDGGSGATYVLLRRRDGKIARLPRRQARRKRT